jgi:hypothetical protein
MEREQWAKHILQSSEKFFDQLMDFAFYHTVTFGQKNSVGLRSSDLALCDFSCRETKYAQII